MKKPLDSKIEGEEVWVETVIFCAYYFFIGLYFV